MRKDISGTEADVELLQPVINESTVVDPPVTPTFPDTSQSPAVKEMEVTFAATPVVKLGPPPITTKEKTISPTFPASALLFVVVPTIPPVVGLNVTLVAVAAPNVGVMKVGEVENTRLVLVVPVAPAAV